MNRKFENERLKRLSKLNEIKNLKRNFIPWRVSVKLCSIYVVLSIVCMLATDKLILFITNTNTQFLRLQLVKGLIYIILTGALLYILMYKQFVTNKRWAYKLLETYEQLEETYGELENTYKELEVTEEELKLQYEEVRKREEDLKKSQQSYHLAVEGSNDGLWEMDFSDNSLYYHRTKELLGYSEEDLTDKIETFTALIHPEDFKLYEEIFKDYLHGKSPYYINEFRMKTKHGNYKWIMSRGKAIFSEDGKPLRMAGSHSDISSRKYSEELIYKMAYYDGLTGLPNRSYFNRSLQEAIYFCRKNNEKMALLFLDLDNFKLINDSQGHNEGDEVLKAAGEMINGIFTVKDRVFRIGGDEFVILLPAIENEEEPVFWAEKIIQAFKDPIVLENHQHYLCASIGIAIYPGHGDNGNTLLKNADAAMYRAKEMGKNQYYIYSKEINEMVMEKAEMEQGLRRALTNKEFFLMYQPQLDLETGRMVGVEALLRWRKSDGTIVPPLKFIPLAEETGLIRQIGLWVLEEACVQNKLWQEKSCEPFKVAVNISAREFEETDFINKVHEILIKTGLDPQYLELEVTEGTLVKRMDYTTEILNKLKSMGISISLDDFGTGYSSMNYLKDFPIDTLKIDKSFIDNLETDSKEQLLTKMVIKLARDMNLTVIAEGVESFSQKDFLIHQGCHRAQGYYFSKPLPVEDIENMIVKSN